MMYKLLILYRRFSTFGVTLGKNVGKEARIMNKIIGGSSKKRQWYPASVSSTSVPQILQPKKEARNSRRTAVINKLFMKYISDLMTSGELNVNTTTLGIDISKVKISHDFSVLKVYWVAKGTSVDDKIESTLSNYSWKLKHELTQLRVIGNVPEILFVRDTSLSKVAEVDAILAKADFGDDFVPTDPSFALLSNLTLSTKLPQHLEEKILLDDGLPEMPVPSMQSDALGLPHDVIMQKIQLSMNKAKAPHRCLAAKLGNEELNSNEEKSSTTLKSEGSGEGHGTEVTVQNSDLKKFFVKRIALQSKVLKTPKNYEPGKEILLSQEGSLDEEEFDDIDILADAQRIKELEILVDDFEAMEDELIIQHLKDENLK